MKTIHADGGAFIQPPDFKFHDAYFTVCDEKGKVIYHNANIGNIYSGLAEYEAIKWAVENIKDRPLKITSDCSTAIAWARKGSSKKSKYRVSQLDLTGVELVYQHKNSADQWNEQNHSPKYDKSYYTKRYYKTIGDKARPKGKELSGKNCPKCGAGLLERNGKYGKFHGCSSFPKCKYTTK